MLITKSDLRIIIFSKYDNLGASSRLRFFQYIDIFKDNGIIVDVSPLFSNLYLDKLYSKKNVFLEVFIGYLNRFIKLFLIKKYDLIIIEKELFPYLPFPFEILINISRKNYIVDFDDAIFHNYDLNKNPLIRLILKNKIDLIMKRSSYVLAGNQYLADRALNAGSNNVYVLPTVVDTLKYKIKANFKKSISIIGWIGTPKTSHYLFSLIPVFNKISLQFPIRIIAVGANEIDFKNTIVESIEWSESKEVDIIQNFDIGIMPLSNTPWEKGKCGYKLIQYMACGIPVVGSNVGVNSKIISHNFDGYLAKSDEDWFSFLVDLLGDSSKRIKMGENGRKKVLENYSLQSQSNNFIEIIKKVKNI